MGPRELSRRSTQANLPGVTAKIASVLLKAYNFDEDSTTLLDFACGSYGWAGFGAAWWGPRELTRDCFCFICFRGLISQQLAPYCKRIVGVDLAEQMVAVFNESVANQGIDASEMIAVQKEVLLDEDSELDGELFDVVLVRLGGMCACRTQTAKWGDALAAFESEGIPADFPSSTVRSGIPPHPRH